MSQSIHEPGDEVTEPRRDAIHFRWVQGNYGVQHLYAGVFAAPLATVSRSMARNAPEPWQVRCGLPGYGDVRSRAVEADARELAERIVQRFIARVSAVVERGE